VAGFLFLIVGPARFCLLDVGMLSALLCGVTPGFRPGLLPCGLRGHVKLFLNYSTPSLEAITADALARRRVFGRVTFRAWASCLRL
jgi:hypothetical protein